MHESIQEVLPVTVSSGERLPILSIVIPSFNSGAYIGRCLDSVARQAVDPALYELIVVDNLSTDDTLQVVESRRAPNTVLICERDKGQSDALNKGCASARGEWLCWLNADDEFVPGSLPLVIQALREANDVNWCGGGMVWIDGEGRVTRCAPHMQVTRLLRALGVATVGGPSSFFRRSLFEKAGPFSTDFHYTMDTDMWHRFQRLGEQCRSLPMYVWAFRVHEQSKTSHVVMTNTHSPKMAAEIVRMEEAYMTQTARRLQRFMPVVWRFQAFFTGRDWKAYRDTRRFRGRSIQEMTANGS